MSNDKAKLRALAEAVAELEDVPERQDEHAEAVDALWLHMHCHTILALLAEIEQLEGFKAAYMEWTDKTEWVQESAHWSELGKHRADVLKLRVDQLKAENEAAQVKLGMIVIASGADLQADLADHVAALRKDAERYRWLIEHCGVTKLPCAIERVLGGDTYVADGKPSIDVAIDTAMSKEAGHD